MVKFKSGAADRLEGKERERERERERKGNKKIPCFKYCSETHM